MTSTPLTLYVVRHQCPHCRRTWAKKPAAEAHIARCWKNPATRSCKTCVHLEPPCEGPYPEHPGWPEDCGQGHDISDGLQVRCSSWQPAT